MVSGVALLLLACTFSNALEENYDPMVAFMCDRPSMYLTSSGWVLDGTTGCLKDPSSILAFCNKVFPKMDIRNVVESTHHVTINNWCNFGEEECQHRFTVVPYRCLAGPFQSEALLVPEGCIFDHIHDSKFCTTLGEWSKSSARNCQNRGLIQNSFSVLQPCEVDRFQGVEFVCCPAVTKFGAAPSPAPTSTNAPASSKVASTIIGHKENKNQQISIGIEGPLHDYFKGDNFVRSKKWNEHESYNKAKGDMEKIHHEKIAKMMKDWGIARQRVQELKSIDPKASEKLNKEVTNRFQKTYEAEELEAEMEKKQLAELHEKRILVLLTEKKNIALDKYISAVEDEEAQMIEIYHALEHYVKILQKERYHSVNKLARIKAYHPDNVIEATAKTIESLDIIDKQVQKALDMLKQVPRFEAKINAMIKKSIISLHAMDNIVDNDMKLYNSLPSTTSTTSTTTTKLPDYSSYDTFSNDDDNYYDELSDDSSVDIKDEDGKNEIESSSHSMPRSQDDDFAKDSDIDDKNEKAFRVNLSSEINVNEKILNNMQFEDEDSYNERLKSNSRNASNINLTTKGLLKFVEDGKSKYEKGSDEDESRSVDVEDGIDEENDDTVEDDLSEDIHDDVLTTFNTAHQKKKTTLSAKTVHEQQQNYMPNETKKFGGSGILLKDEEVDHLPEPAHLNQDLMHAKQSYIGKSRKGDKEFSSAAPLGLTVGTITVAIVIVAGVLVMRRRNNLRQHRMIPTEPMPIDLVTSPEENHVMNMQVNGYENPTYKYFELNAQN